MTYDRDIYNEAVSRLAERHAVCEQKTAERRESFYTLNPRFAEIDAGLSQTASKLAGVLLHSEGRDAFDAVMNENKALQAERAKLLSDAGLDPAFLEQLYNCGKCRDELYIDGKACDCLKKELRRIAYDRLNRSSPLKLASFSDFSLDYYSDEFDSSLGDSPRAIMGAVLEYAKKYARRIVRTPESLLFMGGTGLGKTHLSLSVAREAINEGLGVIYDSVPTLLMKLDGERFGRGYDGTLDSVCECDLLILDDLGAEHSTPSSRSFLYMIINSRMMSVLSTIISTNRTIAELTEAYSDAIYSRLSGDYTPVCFCGSDIRPLKRMQRK